MVSQHDLRKQQKRLTWTSFHLPSTQPWPIWSDVTVPEDNQSLDPHLGYLCNVQGVENVRLARRVENAEQAAFIIRKFIVCLVYRDLLPECPNSLRRQLQT